jgi:hypothetical protein
MSKLRLYSDDSNLVIAESAVDAAMLLARHTGEEDSSTAWSALAPGHALSLWCDESGAVTEPEEDGSSVVSRTVAEWIAMLGRGYVGSLDY